MRATLPGERPGSVFIRREFFFAGVGCILWFAVGLLVFSAGIGRNPYLVFDEPYYIPIAKSMPHGELAPLEMNSRLGRQHPPLGSYLISEGIELAGDNPFGWRLASILSGSLILSAVFLWTFLLGGDFRASVLATTLTLFNNFLYVMSRVAMVDVFEFMFVIWGLTAFTAAISDRFSLRVRRVCLFCAGVLFGLAMACKWNAVDSIAVTILLGSFLIIIRQTAPQLLKNAAIDAGALTLPRMVMSLAVAPVISYFLAFLPLTRATHTAFSLPNLFQMHVTMLRLTELAKGNPALSMSWYQWPLNLKPMGGFSYLVGNPVVMFTGLAALMVCGYRVWRNRSLPDTMVVALYGVNLLQWAITPLKVLNYYYYFSAAMFLGPAIAFALRGRLKILGVPVDTLVALGAFTAFLKWYPKMSSLQAPWDCLLGCN